MALSASGYWSPAIPNLKTPKRNVMYVRFVPAGSQAASDWIARDIPK
jgi:hypothetical protein